jgi:hypothetical protein
MAAAGWLVRGILWIEDRIPRGINGCILPVMEIPVVADGLDAAPCEAFLGQGNLLRGVGLPENIRGTTTVIALEEARSRVPARIAIGAVIADVVLAGNVLGMSAGKLRHDSSPCVKAVTSEAIRQCRSARDDSVVRAPILERHSPCLT